MKRFVLIAGLLAVALTAVAACSGRRADTPLAAAAERGDAAEVKSLLAQKADPNGKDGYGYTAIMYAARNGHTDAIAALLDGGANPNARDCANNGWTPLIHAIHKHQNSAALLLINRGADVNGKPGNCKESTPDSGMTPLMFAAGYDNTEMVKALLDKGADPYASYNDTTALSEAVGGAWDIDRPSADKCPTETVKALLAKAPDLKVSGDMWGKAAVYFAKRNGCTEVMSMLEQRRSVLAWDQKGLRLGSHYVTVTPYTDNTVESDDKTNFHRITAGETTLTIKNDELTVNGKSYGVLKAGEPVDVNHGKVFINSKEVQPGANAVASN